MGDGLIQNNSVVATKSGTCYFLSADSADNTTADDDVSTHSRLDSVHSRCDSLHSRLDSAYGRLDSVHSRFESLHSRLELDHTQDSQHRRLDVCRDYSIT